MKYILMASQYLLILEVILVGKLFKIRKKRNMSKYCIKTITPIHIGNGEVLTQGEDYVHDHEYIKFINHNKLYEEINTFDNPIAVLEDLKDYYLNKSIKKESIKSLYNKQDIYNQEKIRDTTRNKIRKIFDGVKENNKYYIPGSTLKGAFRTALLFDIHKNGPIKDKNKKSSPNNSLRLFDKEVNEEIEKNLGIKGVYFLDSNFIDYKNMTVITTAKYYRNGNKYTKRRTSSNVIAVNKGIRIEFDINFNEAGKINYVFEKMNEYIISAIDREIELFEYIKKKNNDYCTKNLENMLEDLKTIKNKAENFIKEGSNSVIARIGKEKGFHFNTIHPLLDIKVSRNIYKNKVKDPKKDAHPLLITSIDNKNNHMETLGWVEINKIGDDIN